MIPLHNKNNEIQRVALRILIIADTAHEADYYYDRFVYENQEEILIHGRRKTILKDGTIIEKFGITEGDSKLLGSHFDQVLLCCRNNDTLGFYKRLFQTLHNSQVPRGYWFLHYDDEWE